MALPGGSGSGGPCDASHVWIERQRLPLPGGPQNVGAPVCNQLLCCDDTGLAALDDTCTSLREGPTPPVASGSGSGSGTNSNLFGTVETRRLYLPPGFLLGPVQPDQVTQHCCGVGSGSGSGNFDARLHDTPADPSCVVTVGRRRLYLPRGFHPGPPVCEEDPPCCHPVAPNEPCAACPGGLPSTLYVTIRSTTYPCLDGISIPVNFVGGGVWVSASVIETGCLCGSAEIQIARVAPGSTSVFLICISPTLVLVDVGFIVDCSPPFVESAVVYQAGVIIDCSTDSGGPAAATQTTGPGDDCFCFGGRVPPAQISFQVSP